MEEMGLWDMAMMVAMVIMAMVGECMDNLLDSRV